VATLTVGPGEQFTTIEAAVAAASSGDTIDVMAGIYTNDFVGIYKSLTLQAVGGPVEIVATENPPNDKAIIDEGGAGVTVTINGFDISGAVVPAPDSNGAGIRYEGGSLALNNDYIHNNQNGLLATPPPDLAGTGTITINNSEFAFNGAGNGLTHNIYVNDIALLDINGSYIHDANVGHEIKSRAQDTVITNSRIFDNTSTASYSIDLPNGGNADIENNVIEQGPNSENPAIIAYGEEGQSNIGNSVTIAANTIVNDLTSGRQVLFNNPTSTQLLFTNNSVWGLTAAQIDSGPLIESGTTLLTTEPVLDTSSTWQIGIPCFLAGTRIGTPTGEARVEELAVGQRVVTLAGKARPIAWIGHRQLDLLRHPAPEQAQPILIRGHAFSTNVPRHDLQLSPDHAVLIDGKLVPIRLLINGASIQRSIGLEVVTYYHIELDTHDIVLAENLPAETYLDTGNRGLFANSDKPLVLHPDPTSGIDYPTREAGSCAPFVWDEASVRPIWQRLADRAAALGLPVLQRATTTEANLRIRSGDGERNDGKPINADSDVVIFMLRRGAERVRLLSRAQPPTEARPWLEDRRKLGVRVKRIVLRGGNELREIPMDHPGLTKGWWDIERDGQVMSRWTDGDAVLPLPEIAGHVMLEIHLAGEMLYVVDAKPERQVEPRAA
jgi:hypothetical protein